MIPEMFNRVNAYINAKLSDIKAKTDAIPLSPAVEGTATAIKAKTDNIPSSPVDEATLNAIKAKTDNIPANPATAIRQVFKGTWGPQNKGSDDLPQSVTDPAKCIVIVMNHSAGGASTGDVLPVFSGLTTTQISFSWTYTGVWTGSSIDYVIIEYY